MYGNLNSRGLRGSGLEDVINMTNTKYRDKKLALIQKIPTPIKPIQIDETHRQITLAYFEQRSTVDYIGAVQGIPVCFDAKECATDTFPIQNVHEHQILFMQDFESQGDCVFNHLFFRKECLLLSALQEVGGILEPVKTGHAKSFKYSELMNNLSYLPTGIISIIWN